MPKGQINFGMYMRCRRCKHWDKEGECCSIFGYLIQRYCSTYRRKEKPQEEKITDWRMYKCKM
ncbi:MAG: hypothetical protein DRP41_00330 [Thermodesulfobacteriota bacterium]|nr:MAG: hypothetical protein DRP41_00330 [Thermodesulfobacteriota bacterium]